jgi:hypothetical protein
MVLSLPGEIRIEYVRQNGVYMAVSGVDGGFAENDLHDLHMRMLLMNELPGVLRLSVEWMDLKATLLYSIWGKRKLSTVVRITRLNAFELFRLLVRTASILEECRPFLLDERGFVLDPEYMFVGDRIDDIYLIYLPIKDYLEGGSLKDRWRKFILQLVEAAEGMDAEDLRLLLSDGRREDWSLSSSRSVWLQKLQQHGQILKGAGGAPSAHVPSADAPSANAPAAAEGDAQGTGWKDEMEESGVGGKESPRSYEEELIPLGEWDTARNLKAFRKGKGKPAVIKTVAAAAAALAVAALFVPHPWAGIALIGVLVIGVAAAGWSYWRLARRDQKGGFGWAEKDHDEWHSARPSNSQPIAPPGLPSGRHAPSPAGGEGGNRAAGPMDDFTAAPTMALYSGDATVVLDEPASGKAGERKAVLEFRDAGGTLAIAPVTGERLTIGREGGASDLKLSMPGVSRLHCEIVRVQGGYGLVDLGSTNGTRLNGERLVPYKLYPLQEGDVFCVIDTEFTFKFEPGRVIMK